MILLALLFFDDISSDLQLEIVKKCYFTYCLYSQFLLPVSGVDPRGLEAMLPTSSNTSYSKQ